jgi:hypothetical protein
MPKQSSRSRSTDTRSNGPRKRSRHHAAESSSPADDDGIRRVAGVSCSTELGREESGDHASTARPPLFKRRKYVVSDEEEEQSVAVEAPIVDENVATRANIQAVC